MPTRTFTRAELCELSRHLYATRASRPVARPPVRDDQADTPALDDEILHQVNRELALQEAEDLRVVVIGALCALGALAALSLVWWLVR